MSHEEYWLKKLAGNIEKKSFPYDHKAPVMDERRLKRYTGKFPDKVFSGLLKVCRDSNLHLYKILVSSVVLLLHKYTGDGDGDIIIGGPVHRREVETVNTVLAIKNFVHKNATFKEFSQQVGQTIDEAYANEDYPMTVLLWQLNLLSTEDEFPLFDVTVSLEDFHDNSYLQYINTGLKFSFVSTNEYIKGIVEYNVAVYKEVTIKRIFHHLGNLLRESLPNMDIPLLEIDILSAEDKKQLLFDFNNTKTDYPYNKDIPNVFQEQADKEPDVTSVIYQDFYLSYKELNRKSNHVAAFLQTKGIIRDEPVGIMTARSIGMIIGLLGILKAGGAYLPINLDYPKDRKKYILRNANIRILFTTVQESFDDIHMPEVLPLEAPEIYNMAEQYEKRSRYNDSAYIIYTSGSSGKPKGVIVEHQGVIRLVKNTDYLPFNKEKRILQASALEFDTSTFEIWGSLLNGIALCLAHKDDILIPENLKRIIVIYDISTMLLASPLFNQLSDADNSIFSNLDYFITGGDVLSPSHINHVRSACPHVKILNCYGPTENTTFSTAFAIDKNYEENIPIGKPIANSTCYILDENLQLLPLGVPGELVVGGDGVARGYLNAPELTAEKFISFPNFLTSSLPNFPLYRTGDLARYLADGRIEFLGRMDQQVKIRGFRIELGEIENRLLTIDPINEAIVVDLKDSTGDKYLCAYLVAPIELDMINIREKLSELLPEFMIPSYFVQSEKIPLNINGKIDRKKLPDPKKNQRSHDYIKPRNEIENKLAENWAEVLHMEKNLIGIDDDFFKLGGHSLKAVMLAATIHETFNVKLLIRNVFDCPTIRKQAEYIKGAERICYSPIDPAPVKEYYRLSSAQKRMYFMTKLDKESTLYNEQLMEIYQRLTDKEKLENAFKKLIQRHESLRTSFHFIGGEAVQKIHDYQEVAAEFKIEYYESAEDGMIFSPQEGKEWTRVTGLPFQDVVEQFVQPFDLSKPQLLRVGLIKIMKTHQVLMMDMHHIVTDGVSMIILLEELWKLYNGEKLKPISVQYKDFSEWSHSNEHKKEIVKQEDFWLKEISGEIPRLNLPIDYPRPSKMTFDGDILISELNTERIQTVYRTAQINGVTLFMVLLAVYNILLAKLSGQEDIIIGTVTAGRRHADLQKIIGMFVNTLALRNYPISQKKFKGFLAELKEKTLAAFENQDYQFEQLVSKVAPRKEAGLNPIFDVLFELENESDHKEYLLETLMLNKANPYDYKVKKAKFELALIAVESHDGLLMKMEYNSQLFKKETAERFLGYYKKLLVSICSNVEQTIAEIEMIPVEEKNRLLYEFNNQERNYPHNRTIHSLVEEQTMQKPDNIAAVGIAYTQQTDSSEIRNRCHLTYGELNKMAGLMANRLITSGIKLGDIAAIMVEPSLEMFIGLLGILKAGGAFLPIKDGTPPARTHYILKESNSRFLLTRSPLLHGIGIQGVGETIYLDDAAIYRNSNGNPGESLSIPDDIAYVIYTSGSTGKPKGVMLEHRGLVNLCYWHNNTFEVTANDRTTKYAGFGFDASIIEIFPYLITGATNYIVPEEIKLDIQTLNSFYEDNGITISFLPTQVAEQFMTIHNTSLRILQTGGDKLKIFIKRNYQLYNCYGPTEDTVYSTTYLVTESKENIPIGKPIYNYKIYIFDRNNNLQPIGVPGELYIGGDGVARGYLNNPELTADRFKRNVISHSSLVIGKFQRDGNSSNFTNDQSPMTNDYFYKTGDLARWLPDGNIEFLGRMDFQIKIRGFRIELGEIENRLLNCKDIKEAVVIAREDFSGQKYLCAYIVPMNTLDIETIKNALSKNLPDYMIPSFFVQLEKIPLTPNGKIDIRALPAPEARGATAYEAPTNEIEEILAQTWEEILGIKQIGIHDNFFEIGGDSIKTIMIAARLLTHRLSINIHDIFILPTIKELAKNVKKIDRVIDQTLVTGKAELTPIQRWFFDNRFVDGSLSYGHHFNQSILLARKEGFNEEIIKKVFAKIVSHHDVLRMIYKIENNVVIQENRGNEGNLFDLVSIPLKSKEKETALVEIKNEADQIQRSINLQTGPLVKLGLFRGPGCDYLLIVIHHLVIDGVSWQILLEDFDIGYLQAEKSEAIKFQDKTDSYQYWAQKLSKYAETKPLLKELSYWQTIEKIEIKPLPVDYEIQSGERIFADNDLISMVLSEEKTQQLLSGTNWAYNTDINDILLAALGLALKQWAGIDTIWVNLEGHGREPIDDGIDISRTVGWFTTQYPVLLDMACSDDIAFALKNTKETLRRIPKKGIGYGILQYLTPQEKILFPWVRQTPGIAFNYLGQFGGCRYNIIDWISSISDFCTGENVAQEYKVSHKLDIEGVTRNGRLYLQVFYNSREYEKETIEKLVYLLQTNLENVIDHCIAMQAKQQKGITPSDLGCNKISVPELERIIHYLKNNIDENIEIQSIYPLSPMQSGMFFHWLKDKKSPAYFEQIEFYFKGDINPPLFEEALNTIIAHYDVMRTVFAYERLEEPLQIVLKRRKINLQFEDISHLDAADRETFLAKTREKDQQRGFDLTIDHLTRFSLFKTDHQSHIFIWTFHHILMDGWCLGIIQHELTRIYHLLEKGESITLESSLPYAEYIHWLENQDKEEGLLYCEEYLEGYDIPARLPRVEKIKKDECYRKAEYHFIIDKKLETAMTHITGECNATINTFFHAIWGILLQRYNSRIDVVFGTIVSGRPEEINGAERMVGLFINMAPIRVKSPEDQNFALLLEKLQVDSLALKRFEYLPASEVQSRSELKGDLIDHIIIFENYLRETKAENGLTVVDIKAYEQTNYDFNIIVLPWDQLHVHFSYNALVYDEYIIENIAQHLKKIFSQVIDNPHILVKDIDILSETEKEKILFEFNDTKVDYPSDKTIYCLFEEQVEKTPEQTAVIFEDKQLNYKELNEKANQLAHMLRIKGVRPDTLVGFMVNRSIGMIIGLLGILKAGGAYIPIDPEYPTDRVHYMIKESNISFFLSQQEIMEKSYGSGFEIHPIDLFAEFIYMDEANKMNPAAISSSDNLAYVIYTSGSTGKPKGVAICHKNAVNFFKGMMDRIDFSTGKVILAVTTMSFDIFLLETLFPLTIGLKIVIADENQQKNPRELWQIIEENEVNMLQLTPSRLKLLLSHNDLHYLGRIKEILVGGEAFPPHLFEELKKIYHGNIINVYGPTETTVWSSMKDLTGQEEINIGKPIANTQVYILDRSQKLLPIGIPGELHIGGDGIARGYLNRPELTAERFQRNVISHSSLITNDYFYKTGDLARWLPDGNIEFLGRIDFQVKIRGFRIELGEIESQLLNIENIKEAVILAKEDKSGEKYLCAYFTAKETINISFIKDNLSKNMPLYMVPSYFMQIDRIPLTPNGKLDRKALPDPETSFYREYIPPSNEMEKILAEVWEELLNKKVGIHDSFFEIGGDSIKIILIAGRLQRRQIKININDFFAHPTINKLAIYINKSEATVESKPISRDESLIDMDIQRNYSIYLERVKQEKWPAFTTKNNFKSILVTGATGYLGVYLTYELLQLTDATLYLPVRGKSQEDAETRLKNKMAYCFGVDFYNTHQHRLVTLKSDLSEKRLDLSKSIYEELSRKVEIIIHSAANVKHFGDYNESYKDNVKTTEQLLELAGNGCEKIFHHISTIDTGSGDIPGKDYLLYTEYTHDEGQRSENVYVKSKFEAEKRVLDYRKNGLDASIHRAGNMTFNSETGQFQQNIEENFFYSMLKALIKVGFWTDKMKTLEFDLSFVNLAAKAIVLLTQTQLKNETYHICNPHTLTWQEMMILLKELGITPPEVETNESRYVAQLENKSEFEKIIERVKLYSFIWEGKPATLMVSKMDRTVMLLEKLGFQWPVVTKTHIEKMITHCKNVGFI